MKQPEDTTATAPDNAAEASQAEAKPVRRRRAPKAAEGDAAGAAVAEAAEPAAGAVDAPADGDAAPAKPARKRRTPAAKAAEAAETPVSDSPAPAAVDAPRAAEARVEVPPVASPAEAAVAGESDGEAPGGDDRGEPSADGEAPRSGRNRRRGRKDRARGESREGQDGQRPAAALAAPAVAQAGELFAQVLSGDFDIEGDTPTDEPAAQEAGALAEDTGEVAEGGAGGDDVDAAGAPKRVLQPDADAPKLHKVLAQAGIGSRRDMEELILDGHITVNGEPAHIGQRISFGDRIAVKGKPVRVRIVPPTPRIIAYHKPAGEVVTHDDPEHRPTVFRRLPRLQQGKWQSVGRLDLNTEGLLLFTNSGELANQLMHPRFGVEREYAVRVLGTLEPHAKAKLLEGVEIDGQAASFRSIEDGGGEGANHWYRVVITEGRNREVRKLFDSVGLTVSRLIRIRYGTVVLPRGLKRGVWVDLSDDDVRVIRRLAGDAPRRDAPGEAPRNAGQGNNARGNERGGNERGAQNRNERGQGRGNNNNASGTGNGNRNDRGGRGGNRGGNGPAQPMPAQARDTSSSDYDRDEDLDFDPSKIPNPLEQTFDKRFVQKPRGPAGGAGFGRGGGGFGPGGSAPQRGPGPNHKKGGPREPDPLQTSMGYLGADAYHGRGKGGGNRGGGGGGGGGNRGGGGFGGGGGGNRGFGGGGGRRGGR